MASRVEASHEPEWRERAVDRSLREARARALETSGRFLAAAGELLDTTGHIDFTVQEIVERSGQSLRAFYQHFAGKDDLLLALFEDVIERFTADLRAHVEQGVTPTERLRLYVETFQQRIEQADSAGARALSIYHLQLAQDRPTQFASAISSQIRLLAEIVESGVEAGEFRDDLEPATLVLLVTQAMVSSGQLATLGIHLTGARLTAGEQWTWVASAIMAPRAT